MSVEARPRNTVLRRLPASEAAGQWYGGRHRLREIYQRRDLVVLGLGVMIGAGIFKIAGVQAATVAGPAVIISFVVAGVVCLLSALSYAELSSTIPSAGSAYSFTYVIFGELWAWVIGWALILEMLLAAAVVARVWALYAVDALGELGLGVPTVLAGVVGTPQGFELLSLVLLAGITLIVAAGTRLGLGVLWVMVVAKLIVIGLVILVGAVLVDVTNYTPFVPPERDVPAAGGGGATVLAALGGGTSAFGVLGVFAAAGVIAFAYLGFDLIATTAEESADPQRDVPRGMVTSLLLAAALYLGVAVVMVGMVAYDRLDPDTPLAAAFSEAGAGAMGTVITLGALIGLTTVILVVFIALTRVIFSMARDGLLPYPLARVSRRYRAPSVATGAIGVTTIVVSQLVPVLTLEQMVVIGTLFAFVFVSAGVVVLRQTHPELPRGFRVPGVPLVPILAVGSTGWLMLNLSVRTWQYFMIWMAFGLLLYFGYGRRHSRLGRRLASRANRRRGRHAAR